MGRLVVVHSSRLLFIRGNMTSQCYIFEMLQLYLFPLKEIWTNAFFQQCNAPQVAFITLDILVAMLEEPFYVFPQSPALSQFSIPGIG